MLRRSHWAIYHALADKDLERAIQAFDKHFRIVGEQLDKLVQNRKEQPENGTDNVQRKEADSE